MLLRIRNRVLTLSAWCLFVFRHGATYIQNTYLPQHVTRKRILKFYLPRLRSQRSSQLVSRILRQTAASRLRPGPSGLGPPARRQHFSTWSTWKERKCRARTAGAPLGCVFSFFLSLDGRKKKERKQRTKGGMGGRHAATTQGF